MRKAFEGKEYGFFFHFLSPYGEKGKTKEWNEYVNKLDLKKMAAQLHELKAGYAFITVGQNSGYYCTPNSAYDRIVGPGWCSERDIIAEFADELAVYGIDCYVYSTALPAFMCEDAIVKLQAVPPWDSSMHCRPYSEVKKYAVADSRLKQFQTFWNEIHTEWAKRWGKRVKGWWIDGSYYPEKIYDFPDEPNGHTLCRALRSGNPDAVVAFNSGVMYPRRNYPGSDEDYTAGEMNNANEFILNTKYIDGARYHILSYVSSIPGGWGARPLKPAEKLASYTRTIVDNGGVVTWDLPFGLDGIAEEDMVILRDFARRYEESKKIFPACNLNIIQPRNGKNGAITVLTREEGIVNCTWNGKTTPLRVPGSITLPYAGCGRKTVEVECGGFKREITYFGDVYEFTFPFEHQAPYCRMKAEKDGKDIRLRFEIQENTPVDNEAFCQRSCTEVFIYLNGGKVRHFVADFKGGFLEFIQGVKHPLPGLKFEKTADGYIADFPLPCPDGDFCLDVCQHTGIDGELKSCMYFAGSETGKPAVIHNS